MVGDQATEGLLSKTLSRWRVFTVSPWLQGRILDVGCGGGGLACVVPAGRYWGVEPDASARSEATVRFPTHNFTSSLPKGETFDSCCLLAVLEHLPDSAELMERVLLLLSPGGRIVLTTPNPIFQRMHLWGAFLGLFSREAAHEHVALFDRERLFALAKQLGLKPILYRRFMLGANQLLVLERV